MVHVRQELVHDRQRGMRSAAAVQRESRRAAEHGRIARRAQRAERQQLSLGVQAEQLRAELRQLEAVL